MIDVQRYIWWGLNEAKMLNGWNYHFYCVKVLLSVVESVLAPHSTIFHWRKRTGLFSHPVSVLIVEVGMLTGKQSVDS